MRKRSNAFYIKHSSLFYHFSQTILQFIKHNRLNVGRIALERLVGALINCRLLQSGAGGMGLKVQ